MEESNAEMDNQYPVALQSQIQKSFFKNKNNTALLTQCVEGFPPNKIQHTSDLWLFLNERVFKFFLKLKGQIPMDIIYINKSTSEFVFIYFGCRNQIHQLNRF